MDIKDMILLKLNNGEVDTAINLAHSYINSGEKPHDEIFYLLGNAYRKKGDWKHALDNYLEAIALNPQSPAQQAYNMAIDILNFFNKDMYNQ